MELVNFKNVDILGGIWADKQKMLKESTVYAVLDRFKDTGRFDAFKCDPALGIEPHIFWDSDVAKWIEGAAYLIEKHPHPDLEKIIDEVVCDIEKNQLPSGYFNSYYILKEPEKIFTNRDCHELYCLGHLIEAGVAYYGATGKRKLLDLMIKYVDYVEKRFKIDQDAGFFTPGHEEIELALVRLYEVTGDKKHLDLATFFVSERGKSLDDGKMIDWADAKYSQSHAEPKNQLTAEGHSVRAVYLYCAMADLAILNGDKELERACKALFEDIIKHKMYITGGIGSTHIGEAFTVPYDLPSEGAYSESCAAIGLVFFAQRMLALTGEKKYADTIERVLYNGFLSSVSLDGKSFFYVNPLEIVPANHTRHASVKNKDPLPPMHRFEVFDCSCCPPNIVRFLGSLGSLLYTKDEKGIYVQQFAASKAKIDFGGKEITIEQKTAYPENGKISFVSSHDVRIFVRVPEYLDTGALSKTGYIPLDLEAGVEKSIDFEIPTYLVSANPLVRDTAGKVALLHGPVVYCLEGHDNPYPLYDIRIDKNTEFYHMKNDSLGVNTITVDAYVRKEADSLYAPLSEARKKIRATFIPYHAFANRGDSPMQVWTLIE